MAPATEYMKTDHMNENQHPLMSEEAFVAYVEREKRKIAEEGWREVSGDSGKPCPIPLEEFYALGKMKALEKIQKMGLEPLNHPGTPEYEECMSDLREMIAFDKTPRFPQFVAQERKEPNGKQQ